MSIEKLKSKAKIIQSSIELKKIELNDLERKIFELEYPIWEWYDLENWLKENRKENDYAKNPIVAPLNGGDGYISYCKLTGGRELQIGAYFDYQGYTRGGQLRVHHDFKSWR